MTKPTAAVLTALVALVVYWHGPWALAGDIAAAAEPVAAPKTAAPEPNIWVVPPAMCPNFAGAAAKACGATFMAETNGGKDLDENGKRNVLEICTATEAMAQKVCSLGVVKLDRSSHKNFCVSLGASYASLTQMGCSAVVKDAKDLNPPEDLAAMLESCKEIGRAVFERYVPVCILHYQGKPLPGNGGPDPEKDQPGIPAKPAFNPNTI